MQVDELLITAVLTTAGTVAFAPLVTGLIEVLKSLRLGGIDGNEPRAAALIALILVVLAQVQLITSGAAPLGIQTLFLGFTSWYALTRLAMGVHDDLTGSRRSLTAGLAGNTVDTDPGPG